MIPREGIGQNSVYVQKITIALAAIFLIVWSILGSVINLDPPKNVKIIRESFSETSEVIDNPDRGLYSIVGFYITDKVEDYHAKIDRMIRNNATLNLLMIQINLANYADCTLSPEALVNIDNLFSVLQTIKQNVIVRFLYDWDGKAEDTEPQNIDIIINHMTQLKYILDEYQDRIYLIQGLFTGNWGEMNGTRYGAVNDMQRLAEALQHAAGDTTFLSVRTGRQWRNITGIYDINDLSLESGMKIGLYNDGMMGNQTDCGTYYSNSSNDDNLMAAWSREKELEFQNYLCRYVPNGGEVILDNSMNDFENAVSILRTMHISYLNYDYDKNVLNKWKTVTIEDGVYKGLDGLSYIERHLGYRILIQDTQIAYNKLRDQLILNVELKNVGFAPVYSEKFMLLNFYDENNALVYSHQLDYDIRQLYGGDDSCNILDLYHEIQLDEWAAGAYTIYLNIYDSQTNEELILANEQSMTQYGYKIAEVRRN